MGARHGPLLDKGDRRKDGLQAFCSRGQIAWEVCWWPREEISRDAYGPRIRLGWKKWGRILAWEEVLVTESAGNLLSIWGVSWKNKIEHGSQLSALTFWDLCRKKCRGFQTRKVPDVLGIAFTGWFEIRTHFYLLHKIGKVCLSKYKEVIDYLLTLHMWEFGALVWLWGSLIVSGT